MVVFSRNSGDGSQRSVPSAVSVIAVPLPSLPLGCRGAVHRQGGAGYERGLLRAEKGGELRHLLRLDEAFDRRPAEHYLLDHLLLRDAARARLVRYLPLHER